MENKKQKIENKAVYLYKQNQKTMNHTYEIKLIQNLEENYYEVQIDGYAIHRHNYDSWEHQQNARRFAKSIAWDNALQKAEEGKKFTLKFEQIR